MTENHATNDPAVLGNDSKRSKSPLSPQLKIEPANEWASHTITALDSTEVARPTSMTPGFELPGGYPYTPGTFEPGPSLEDIKGAAKEYLCAAGQYVPSQEDVKWIAQSAGSTVRGYMPDGVAAYLGPPQSIQEATAVSPVEERETTPTAAGTFVLINRGDPSTRVDARENHDVKHEPVILPGAGDTKDKPSDTLGTGYPSVTNDQADSNASTKTQPGSPAAAEQMENFRNDVATPFIYQGPSLGADAVGSSPGLQVHPAPALRPASNIIDTSGPKNSSESEPLFHQDVQLLMIAPDGPGAATGDYDGPGAGNALEGPRTEVIGNSPSAQTPEKTVRASKESADKVEDHNKGVSNGACEEMGSKQLVEQSNVNTFGNTEAPNQPLNDVQARRTNSPEKKGLQWRQEVLDRDEDRGLVNGRQTGLGIRAGGITAKTDMNKVHSNAATTGHDIDEIAPKSSTSEPRFTEPSTPQVEQLHPSAPSKGVDESSTAPPEAEEPIKKSDGHAQVERRGRRKGSFLTRIRDWSKRMSQDRKAKTERQAITKTNLG